MYTADIAVEPILTAIVISLDVCILYTNNNYRGCDNSPLLVTLIGYCHYVYVWYAIIEE